MLEDLKDLIGRSLQRHGLDDHYIANMILESCAEVISTNTPKIIIQNVRPISYKHGVIFMCTKNQAAAQEFRLYADLILKKVQEKHPKEDIRRFSYRLGSLDRDSDEVGE
ncbi:MAG: DciA family protein [Patescibacteria group bacterium]|jgi:hypothetical protein